MRAIVEVLLWATMASAIVIALYPDDEPSASSAPTICRLSYAWDDGRESTWSIDGVHVRLYWQTQEDYGELGWWPSGYPSAITAVDPSAALVALVRESGTSAIERWSVEIDTERMTRIWLRRPMVLLESDEIGPVDWIEQGDPGELFLLAGHSVWRLDPSGGLAQIWRDPEAGVRTLVVVGSGDDLRISLSRMGPMDGVVSESDTVVVIDRDGRTR